VPVLYLPDDLISEFIILVLLSNQTCNDKLKERETTAERDPEGEGKRGKLIVIQQTLKDSPILMSEPEVFEITISASILRMCNGIVREFARKCRSLSLKIMHPLLANSFTITISVENDS